MCANFWNKKKLEYDNETIERERDRLDEVSARLRTCMIIGTQRLQQWIIFRWKEETAIVMFAHIQIQINFIILSEICNWYLV